MKVSIISVSRKSGKYGNVPSKSNISLLEDGTHVNQYINDLYFSNKIDGVRYKSLLKKAALYTNQNNAEAIEKMFFEGLQ